MLPISQLDVLYVHIISQILKHMLLFVQLLLSYVILSNSKLPFYVAIVCNIFQLFKSTFRDICHHLYTVIIHEASFNPLSLIDSYIDLSHSYSLIKINGSIQTSQTSTISTIFINHFVSTTNCFMISFIILLIQVPSI